MSEQNDKRTAELSMDELENVAGGDARVNSELEQVTDSASAAPAPTTNSRAVTTKGISGK
jgi:hypothetical protein